MTPSDLHPDPHPDLHPIVSRAADGILPGWARAGEERREHMARVADVLEGWARALDREPGEIRRWRSLGFLHDALRDAAADDLRSMMDSSTTNASVMDAVIETREGQGWRLDRHAFGLDRVDCPGDSVDEWAPVDGSLHGPAMAARLAGEGVEDGELLSAVAYHTVGHPDLGAVGRALYCADFLEPGRPSDGDERADLRARYTQEPDAVLRAVLRKRIGYLLQRGRPIFLGTVRMWNRSSRSE